jgi:hypothetical protein
MNDDNTSKPLQPFGVQFLEVPTDDLTAVDGGGGCRRPKPVNGKLMTEAISLPLAHHRCPDYS